MSFHGPKAIEIRLYMVIFLYNLYILVWIKGGCIAIMDFALDSGKTFTWLRVRLFSADVALFMPENNVDVALIFPCILPLPKD